ncbi:MAG: DUF1566 domain-containing protein [Betaproteobacteria bacterium]
MFTALAISACPGYLATGQVTCYDTDGHEIPCRGRGQDAEYRHGIPWPQPRFERQGEIALDRLTGLAWTRDANPGELPMTWQEALDRVTQMNRVRAFGYEDWRLPNRRELRSLVSHQTRKPALPEDHPFLNVFPGWYWSSTTAAISPAHAWYVHLEGARMFYGGKDQSFLLWPVRGTGNGAVPATGQTLCYDAAGLEIPCHISGQDGELQTGRPWPQPRFAVGEESVLDRLTGLSWRRDADIARHPVSWGEALAAVSGLNLGAGGELRPWRLPNINELESLADCARHSPALPSGHPFEAVQAAYWSATTSAYEPDWAWALYLDQGAVGVGQKRGRHFRVWAVRDGGNGSS